MIHATVDIGQMVDWISQQLTGAWSWRKWMSGALKSSDWVVNSKGRVISRGVTSCAGMTAQHVLLAQTKNWVSDRWTWIQLPGTLSRGKVILTRISLTDLPGPCLGLCVGVACFVVLGCFVVGFFLLGKFDLNHMLIPVVDRPCLALVRQCKKKKEEKLS